MHLCGCAVRGCAVVVFFQAEDGIRDHCVTGVQTCALPISPARIFGTKQGNMSGTNILYLIPRSGVWDKDADVSSVYIDSMSWVYTKGAWGQKIDGLYDQAIQGTECVVRNWSSNMTSQLSNHHAYEYLGGLSMAVKAL